MPIMYYRFPPYIRGGLQIEIEGQSFLITSLTDVDRGSKVRRRVIISDDRRVSRREAGFIGSGLIGYRQD
jgi:hypothetical protein